MSFRNTRRQMSSQVARSERNQMKLQRLRDQVRQSTTAFMARQHARLAWWQSAFRTPALGFYRSVCSQAMSLWAAFMAILGLNGKSFSSRRPVAVRRNTFRTALCEGLEDRQLMASDLFATAVVVSGSSFSIADNNSGFNTALEPSEPQPAIVFGSVESTAWYQWTAPVSGLVTLSVTPIGATPMTDPLLGVYTGSTLGTLVLKASGNDEIFPLYPEAKFNAISGTTYSFQVGDDAPSFTSQGTFSLNLVTAPTISVLANDTFVQEDPSAAPFPNNGQFRISTSIPQATPTLVTYTLTGLANLIGTVGVDSGDDYKAQVASTPITATGTLTIPALATQLVVDIDVIDDLLFDGGNESVILTLTSTSAGIFGKAADTMNIVDNELAPTISITATDSTATENVGGTDPGQFTVTMSGASDTNTVVALNYAAGNPATVAVNGLDYSALASVTIAKGTTFQAGATSSTTTVAVINDLLVEGSETVTASLGLITGNTGIVNKAPTSAVVTIFDDPDTSLISIGAFSAATVSEPVDAATAVISMTKAASTNTVVKFALFTGTTAIEGTDYTLGELNEIESNNTATGPQPLGDGPQGLAGFSLASKANIAVSTSTPHVTINSLVGSNVALNADVYSFYTSTGGAAIFDIDNAGAFNSFLELLDASGNVLAFNDNFFEGVGIGSGAGPSTTDSQISFTLPSAGVYMIRVSASILPASANSALTGSSSGGVPIGSAYQLHLSVPGSSGFAVIGAGSTTVPLTVTVIDDLLVEPTEIINVRLDSITSADPDISFLNASPADASRNATVSILDNDVAKVSASSTNALEPTTSGVYTFTQTLLSATDTVIKLVIDGSSTTKDSVNGTVNDPADHSLAQTVTVTIGAGSTQATLTVPIIDSLLIEQDETLVLNMTLIGTTDPDITINTVANPGSKALMLFGDEDSGVVAVDATFAPAVEGGAIGKFTFFLSEISPLFTKGYPFSPLTKSDRDVVIEYTIGGTAINGVDYDFLTGTATIPAFSSTVTILVDATGAFDDMLLEGPETVSVTITKLLTPTDSNIDIDLGSPADSLVINDNDALTVKIASTQNTTEGGALGKFVFSTSGVGTTTVPTVVTYQVKAASSTAVQGVDFASLSGTATIPAGAASQTVAINIDATGVFNDSLFEGTETVTIEILTVSGGPGVVVDPIAKQDTGLIFDDETGQVTIAKTLDAAEGFSNGLFTVSLGGQSPLPTVVKLEVVPAGVNNATSGVDYTAIGGPFTTITFNPFQTQVTVPVNVIDDGISELTESVIVRVNSVLSGAYTPNVSPATVLIFSDQVVSITASLPAASEPSTNGEFVLSLSTPGFAGATTSSLPTVVTFTIAAGAGQASNGTDYKSLALSATIPANASTVAIPVSVLNDLTLEGNETVTLTLTGISSGNGDITVNAGSKVATVTISDDDSAYLTVATTKGPGQDNLASDVDGAFTITMSNPSDQNTVVKFSIAGTATSGTDFTSIPLSATILANQTQVLIPVDVLNDNIVEGTETVVIKLQSPTTSPYAAKIFLGAIGSTFLSDGLATVSFRDGVNGYIGTTDTSLDQFAPAVNRGLDTVLSVSVDTGLLNERDGLLKFDGIVGTTNGLIPSGTKLVNATVELLTTAGNVVVYQLLLPFNELVDTWSNSFGANGVQPNGFEAANIGTPAVTGGPISISSPLLLSTIQSWINGGTNNGLALLSPNSFLFNSSEDVTIANRPRLTATLDLSATLDIIDTDTATVSVIGSNAASEPGTNGSLVIGLSSKASTDVVVFFNDVLSGTAISGSDYVAIPAGSVTIFAGSTTATIAVVPNNDSLVEAPETVNLVISKITVTDPEITLGSPATGTVIINDNDFALVSITSTTDGDENGFTTPILGLPINGSFTISMSTPSSVDTVVSLIIGGTATSGSDYTAIPLSVTIPANFLSTTIPVAVIDDLINEAPIETVTLSLTGVTSGLLTQTFVGAPSSATVNIADDEQPLTVNNVATKATATEGGPNGEFQFQLNFPSDNPTTITYKFLGTSTATPAINGTSPDFNASALTGSTGPLFTTGTVVIPTGSTTVALPVNAYQDFIAEIGGETVNLQITSISNNNPSGIGIASTTVTIQDVVYIVSVLKTDSPAAEPGPPAGSNGQFTFSLTAPLPEPTVVTYSIGGTATPSTPVPVLPLTPDYVGLTGTLTIPANTTQFKLSVLVIDDLIVEPDETVIVQITGASSAGPTYLLPGNGVPTVGFNATSATEIINDNDSATISITGVDGTELGQPAGIIGNFPDGKFVISQDRVSSSNTVVTYAVQAASTATNGTDYTAITGTLTATILAGQTSTFVVVDVLQDNILEPTETVVMKILTTVGVTDPQITIGGTNQATVNIVDDDTATVSLVPIGPVGFEPGSNDGQYAVILSNPSSLPTVVTYSLLAPGPTDATPGSDFSLRDGALNPIGLLTGSVTIPAGQTSTPIIVDVLDDNIIENAEAVNLKLSGTNNAKVTVNATPALVTILDSGSADQDLGKVTIAKLVDGDESPLGVGKTDGQFILTLVPTNPFFNAANGPFSSDENTVVTYSISGASTALNPSDHTLALTGTVTITAGQTTAILTVPVVDDNMAELPESLTISLTGTLAPTHTPAIVVDATPATIAMLDDDVSVLTITSQALAEGPNGTTAMVFTVTSPNAVQGGFSVVFSVGGGNATNGVDYTVVTGSPLAFTGNAGETRLITVNINGDNVVELSETFNVTLGTATPGLPLVQTGAVGVGTITNDDTATITISSPTVVEGTNGTPGVGPFTPLVFNVSTSNPIDIPYTIDVLLGNGTAIGGDFDPTLAIPLPITVNVLNGLDFDNDLGNNVNAFLSQVTFPAAANTIGVQPVPAALPITVRVVQDDFVEGGTVNNFGSETIAATLGDITASRATVVTATGTGTITDDDAATVSLVANDNQASEPLDTVNLGNGQFTVTQTKLSSSNTVITYSVAVSALSATPSGVSALEDDYTKLTGSVTILAGQSTATIDVTVLDNTLVEDDETVVVTLTGFASRDPNVVLSTTLTDTVTIFDDDQANVTIVANDKAASEDPLDPGQFTLTMDAISDTDTVVTYSIATGGVNATNGSDYSTLTGTATITAGKTTTTIDVVVLQDAFVEGAETVTLTLTGFLSPTNADIKVGGPATDTVTIADDTDGIIVSVFNNGNGTEGGNNGSFIVRITKSDGITPVPAPATGLTVNYSSVGGTAVGGPLGDYVALSGLIFIPPGATTGLIDVSVIDDTLVEATETVNVTLVTLSLATFPVLVVPFTEPVTIGTANATVNIIDNDKAVFTVEDLVVNEGDGTGTLTIKISNKLEGISVPVTVNYTPLTAGSPSDFSPLGSQTVTFLPGSLTSQTVTFTIVDDGLVEGLEGFGVSFSTTYANGSGLHVVDTTDTAVVAILDNDSAIFAIQDVKVGSTSWSATFNDFVDNTGAPIGQRGYSIPVGAAQATTLPWFNIDRLYVSFSQDPDVATLTASNFLLFGLQGALTPSITNVAYDTVTNVATLTLSGTVTNDRLRLRVNDAVTFLATPLDGDWANNASTFVSGNGTPGGAFDFTFNVLPGDVNQGSTVNTTDASIVFSRVGASTDGVVGINAGNGNPYSSFIDVNGSGTINTTDAAIVFSRISLATSTLPSGSPGVLIPGGGSGNSDNSRIIESLKNSIGNWTPNPIPNPIPRPEPSIADFLGQFSENDKDYIESLAVESDTTLENGLVDSVFSDLFRQN